MAKLSLRFRQVFEHPTHFKLVKPAGNPLIIAKKALSPGLQNRLRKFADGGGVTDPVDVEPPVEPEPMPAPQGAELVLPDPLPPEAVVADNSLPDEEKVAGKEDIEPEAPAASAMPEGASSAVPVAPMAAQVPADNATPPKRILTAAQQHMAQLQGFQEQLAATEEEMQKERGRVEAEALNSANETLAKTTALRDAYWKDYLAAGKDAQPYFSKLDTSSKIGTVASIILGSIATGLTGRPNVGIQMFDKAVSEEIDRQKDAKDSMLRRYLEAGMDVKQAELMVRSYTEKILASKLSQSAVKIANIKTKMDAVKMAYDMERKAEMDGMNAQHLAATTAESEKRLSLMDEQEKRKNAEEVRKNEQLELSKKNLAVRWQEYAVRKALGEKGLMLRERELSAQQEKRVKDEEEKLRKRTFNADTMPVIAKDDQVARKAQDELAGILDYTKNVKELNDYIKAHPTAIAVGIWNLETPERAKVRELAAKALETFPKSESFKRALNVTASKIIKEAQTGKLDNAISIFLGNADVIANSMLDHAITNYTTRVMNNADASDPLALQMAKIAADAFAAKYGLSARPVGKPTPGFAPIP